MKKEEEKEEIIKALITILKIGSISYILGWSILVINLNSNWLVLAFILYGLGISGLTIYFTIMIICSLFKIEPKGGKTK